MIQNIKLLQSAGMFKALSICSVAAALLVSNVTVQADDGLDRLLKKARIKPPTHQAKGASAASIKSVEDSSRTKNANVACVIPNAIQSSSASPASHSQDFSFTDPTGFAPRSDNPINCEVCPPPIGYGQTYGQPHRPYDPERPIHPWNPNSQKDEYVFDGNDRGKRVRVDQSWNLYGVDTEDTFGHFDTLDGRRLVTPSNRVAIYAPRFAAVRKVDGLINAQTNTYVGEMEEKTMLMKAERSDRSTTSKQHVAVDRFEGSKRASGLLDRTRGVVADNTTHLFGIRNTFEAFENLSLIRTGRHSSGESARLKLGVLSAQVWEDDLGLQVTTQNAQPVIVNDIAMAQQLVTIESDDDQAILRVTKLASKISARTGEKVDFTLRFDNLSGRRIGNVTIVDNLTRRLEYVQGSAECSLNSEFIAKENDGGSLMLRWEITDPVPANSGGIIRFRCRVK
jgi:uncharacterized repeat protein (TIGR01451 family)